MSSGRSLRICVYGSASPNTSPAYLEAAERLAELIAASGHTLINGAGANGVMGALNRAAIRAGGRVEGVAHENMVDGPISELQAAGMQLRIARGSTLEERKRLLRQGSDAFIALPGGPGTWEELWEVANQESLWMLNPVGRPVVLVNTLGFYDGSVAQLERAHKDGILRHPPAKLVKAVGTPEEALAYVVTHPTCTALSSKL